MEHEILQDVKRGKEKPWKPKKLQSLKLADSFHRIGEHKKANRVWWCTSALGFIKNLDVGKSNDEQSNTENAHR